MKKLISFCLFFVLNFFVFGQCPTSSTVNTSPNGKMCIQMNITGTAVSPITVNGVSYIFVSQSGSTATYKATTQNNCSGASYSSFSGTIVYDGNTCIYSNGVLPLNFISYKSKYAKSELALDWNTTNEINVDHFKVEWSSSGEEWESKVLAINVLEERSNARVYSTTVSGILVKPNYLRLVGVDLDGSETKTKIFSPDVQIAKEISIAPNPTNGDRVAFSCFDCAISGSSIDILTIDGKRIKSITKLFNGDMIDVSDLAKGIYFLKVTDGNLASELTKLVRN